MEICLKIDGVNLISDKLFPFVGSPWEWKGKQNPKFCFLSKQKCSNFPPQTYINIDRLPKKTLPIEKLK